MYVLIIISSNPYGVVLVAWHGVCCGYSEMEVRRDDAVV